MRFYKLSFLALAALAAAAPQRGKAQTAQQQAAQIPQGISQANDGSTILDTTAMINGLPIRYRVSGPAAMFTAASNVTGASATQNTTDGSMGLNVLLHGDGGQSFFDFPNQNVQANLMGVAVLAPDPNLFWGGGSGLNRTDGVPHSQAVADLVQTELPKMLAFNMSQVYFTGVSGGSLTLSGFFLPAQMTKFQGTGMELNCGAMPPQVDFVDQANVLASTPIHYQSTQNELSLLQGSIPQAVSTYQQLASQSGMSTDQINALQTADNTPIGGHCAFDGQSFSSGNQLLANSYSNIIQPGGNGTVQGIGNVKNGVVGMTLNFGKPNETVV